MYDAGNVIDSINLGSSQLVTINRLVDIVEELAGVKLERKYDLSAPQGVRGRNSDNTLILERLNWEPTTSLETGMAKTYAWIRDRMLKLMIPLAARRGMDWMYAYNPCAVTPRPETSAPRYRQAA